MAIKSFFLQTAVAGLLGLFGQSRGRVIPHSGSWVPGGLVSEHGVVELLNGTSSDDFIALTDLRRHANKAKFRNRRDDIVDAADFSWIKRWAAIGDSFTAGIGAGHPLGSIVHNTDDWHCSRYDSAYPRVLNRAFGPAVESFQYVACSGDRTEDIYTQALNLEGNLDLVILTAGGNDLCLADMIKTCVFMEHTVTECETVIALAQNNLDHILGNNMKEVLRALNSKMNENGIVIYNGYAQFFDTTNNDDCGGQDWSLMRNFAGQGLPLTKARRERFNDLVVQINNLIKGVVHDISEAEEDGITYKLGFSNWDPWVYEGVKGQFCDPSSSGEYPDPKQPDLQFFKPNTVDMGEGGELKRRDNQPVPPLEDGAMTPASPEAGRITMDKIYRSSLMHSRNPAAVALSKLDPRAPLPPGCPSDTSIISIPVPDDIGKNFHPNELGHVTIASFAAAQLLDMRADLLESESPMCTLGDSFRCWQTEGRRSYALPDLMDHSLHDYCDNQIRVVDHGRDGWVGSETYYPNTKEEHIISVTLGRDYAATTSEDDIRTECREALNRIVHGCDGNDPANPMNWKFGGQWVKGPNTWEITPVGNRRWPIIQAPGGKCVGWYKFGHSEYEVYGYGWTGHTKGRSGRETFMDNINKCGGEAWDRNLKWLDPATNDGYEWRGIFRKYIWVRARCFANNKVAFASGGFTNGCGGND